MRSLDNILKPWGARVMGFKQGQALAACEFTKTCQCLQGGCVGAVQGMHLSAGCGRCLGT